LLAITCFALLVTCNIIPSCPENSQQNNLSFYSHVRKLKERKIWSTWSEWKKV